MNEEVGSGPTTSVHYRFLENQNHGVINPKLPDGQAGAYHPAEDQAGSFLPTVVLAGLAGAWGWGGLVDLG